MVEVTVSGGSAVFEIEGLDKLWSLRSRLEIPLAHIRGVRLDPQIAHGWWHGLRTMGTQFPGVITAGTFHQHGKRVFWDVRDPDRTLVVELADERYDELVVEVESPATTLGVLQHALRSRGA
jgi:hypothetical protein